MVMPTTVRPWRTSIAATVELSTPPLMATAMGNSGMHRNPAQMRHAGADGLEDVGGREGSAGTGRAGGDGEAAQIEGDDHGFAIDAVEVEIAGIGHAIPTRSVDAGAGNV